MKCEMCGRSTKKPEICVVGEHIMPVCKKCINLAERAGRITEDDAMSDMRKRRRPIRNSRRKKQSHASM